MRAVIFDFDGVIVDSEHLHARALREVTKPLGIDFPLNSFIGWSDAEAFRHLHDRAGLTLTDAGLDQLLDRKHDLLLSMLKEGLIQPYPGVVELIRSLARRVPLAVCSAAFRTEIEPVLDRLDLASSFRTVVGSEDVPAAKPDPAPYLTAAARLSLAPADCTAIEDSAHGVASAKGAGMRVIAVGHTTPRDRLARADRYVERIEMLTAAELAPCDSFAR